MKPSIGTFQDGGEHALIDLPRLLETRMLVQCNSGGGKSWSIRRLLEQTAGQVQQLVIDPEGEFATLREKHDYVIAAPHDGDALAHPKTAQLLARRLLETGVSAILDIYDLKAHERQAFVRIFLEALVNAPKALWQPCLIVLDEAHVFCPEAGKAESAGAVIDLATRGRKRGFALIAATQRLAKLHKDAAAECLNKLVGRTGLDVDVKRAADELGMTPREAMEKLRPLAPGEFFAFGPALSTTVRRLKVGPIATTHPKAGERALRAPPKPTAAIVAVLPKLSDLPKEAEAEARSIEDLKRELANARRELTVAKSARSGHSKEDMEAAKAEGYAAGLANARESYGSILQRIAAFVQTHIDASGEIDAEVRHHRLRAPTAPSPRPATRAPAPRQNGSGSLTGPRQLILDKLAWLQAHDLYPAPKETLAAVCGVSPTSGGYFNNLGALRSSGLIEYPASGTVILTEAGAAIANATDDPRPVHEHWLEIVTGPQRAILEALLEKHPTSWDRNALARHIGVSETSGGYFNNLGRLRTLGAIDYPQAKMIALTKYVMP